MKKVNFVIAGTAKGGTSTLFSYLTQNPQICMSNVKEPHFFNTDSAFKDKPNYRYYHDSFISCKNDKLWGEGTPIYMWWYDAPRRIWEYNPDMKWILLLRNPNKRAFSHWNMLRRQGIENLDFYNALLAEEQRSKLRLPRQHQGFSYIDRGFYTDQIRRIWHYFPKRQVLILKSESFYDNPQRILDETCAFLGIETMKFLKPQESNFGKYNESISVVAHEYLLKRYFWQIRELESMLGWDLTNWKL